MRKLRADRPVTDPSAPFYVRYDEAMGGTFAQLWFLTRGCTWDRAGACTMCNYGHAEHVSADEMVGYVERGLASIRRPIDELYVSPSGSLLDPKEVPVEARRRILASMADVPVRRLSFETRPETVTSTTIKDVVFALSERALAVGFGLESADPFVLQHCVNKRGTTDAFVRAARALAHHGFDVYANIALGSAFLTEAEAIEDAVASVNWALRNGSSLALVFPMHVKQNTLLAWLYSRGRYRPPSLWSLIEVLERLDGTLLEQVTISWYRDDYGSRSNVIAGPTTCPRCEREVLRALDRYRAAPGVESAEAFGALRCDCRERWSRGLANLPDRPLPDRVRDEVVLLSSELDLTGDQGASPSGPHC
jgi:archaeosine synthase beta-subunit